MVPFSRLECHTKVEVYPPFEMDYCFDLLRKLVVHGKFAAIYRYLKIRVNFGVTLSVIFGANERFNGVKRRSGGESWILRG